MHQLMKFVLVSTLSALTPLCVYAENSTIDFGIEIIQEVNKEVNKTVIDLAGIDENDENKIGDLLYSKIKKDIKHSSSSKFNVSSIFNNLTSKVKRKKIKYSYMIVNDKSFNAYTIIGGRIFIDKSLIEKLDNENQLAFIIAHEISHNELKHCIYNIQHGLIAGTLDPSLGQVVQFAYTTYKIPFNKYDEFDADKSGVKLMEAAGYDRYGAIQVFELFEKIEKKSKVKTNEFLSTHASPKERKKKIKELKQ